MKKVIEKTKKRARRGEVKREREDKTTKKDYDVHVHEKYSKYIAQYNFATFTSTEDISDGFPGIFLFLYSKSCNGQSRSNL